MTTSRRLVAVPNRNRQTTPLVPMTPEAFLAALPGDRRATLSAVREVVRRNLPNGYEESVRDGMLLYCVPLARYAGLRNKQPLWYAALASHKSYNSLHLMSVYCDAGHMQRLRDGFVSAGKKLDMGKACIHFDTVDDLPLDVIGELIASVPVEKWIAIAAASRKKPGKRADA